MSQGYFTDGGAEPRTRRQPGRSFFITRGFNPIAPDPFQEHLYTPQSEVATAVARSGNNRYGAAGTRKCRRCRSRKTKCQFTNPDEPCEDCRNKNEALSCGAKITAQQFKALGKGRRRARESPDLGGRTWQDIRQAKLSDVVIFVEGKHPGKSHEEVLQLVVDLERKMANQADLTLNMALEEGQPPVTESPHDHGDSPQEDDEYFPWGGILYS